MLKTASSVTNALGALVYQGTWDANANSPTLTSSVGTKGNYYVVSVSGTTNLNGISSWSVGDWAVFNGSVWQKVDGGTSESFVNLTVTGTANIATGNVVNMTSSNVTITGGTENAVTYTNVTVSSGNVTVTNDNVAYSNISTALRTQSLTGYLYGNANTGNVTASTSIPVANVTGAVSSVTGTSPISSSGGTTPAISLNTSGVTAASYGGAANSATITVDTYGRITAASNTAIAIANTQVSGLGTMSTQNSNNVTITGGNVGANLSTSTAIPVANATGTLATNNGGTGLMSFTNGGVLYASSTSVLSTSLNLYFDGNNLGIGTTSPTSANNYHSLTLNGTTGVLFDLKSNGTTYGRIQTDTNYALALWTATASPMTFGINYTVGMTLDSSFNLSVTGNVVQATAGKGINFTANTPASGMTSQLLNWYEEGTWTPNQGSGLTVVGTFSSVGYYVKIGKSITVNFRLSATTSIVASNLSILLSNLPFSVKPDGIGAFGVGVNSAGTTTFNHQASGTSIYLEGSNIASTTNIYGSVTYITT